MKWLLSVLIGQTPPKLVSLASGPLNVTTLLTITRHESYPNITAVSAIDFVAHTVNGVSCANRAVEVEYILPD